MSEGEPASPGKSEEWPLWFGKYGKGWEVEKGVPPFSIFGDEDGNSLFVVREPNKGRIAKFDRNPDFGKPPTYEIKDPGKPEGKPEGKPAQEGRKPEDRKPQDRNPAPPDQRGPMYFGYPYPVVMNPFQPMMPAQPVAYGGVDYGGVDPRVIYALLAHSQTTQAMAHNSHLQSQAMALQAVLTAYNMARLGRDDGDNVAEVAQELRESLDSMHRGHERRGRGNRTGDTYERLNAQKRMIEKRIEYLKKKRESDPENADLYDKRIKHLEKALENTDRALGYSGLMRSKATSLVPAIEKNFRKKLEEIYGSRSDEAYDVVMRSIYGAAGIERGANAYNLALRLGKMDGSERNRVAEHAMEYVRTHLEAPRDVGYDPYTSVESLINRLALAGKYINRGYSAMNRQQST